MKNYRIFAIVLAFCLAMTPIQAVCAAEDTNISNDSEHTYELEWAETWIDYQQYPPFVGDECDFCFWCLEDGHLIRDAEYIITYSDDSMVVDGVAVKPGNLNITVTVEGICTKEFPVKIYDAAIWDDHDFGRFISEGSCPAGQTRGYIIRGFQDSENVVVKSSKKSVATARVEGYYLYVDCKKKGKTTITISDETDKKTKFVMKVTDAVKGNIIYSKAKMYKEIKEDGSGYNYWYEYKITNNLDKKIVFYALDAKRAKYENGDRLLYLNYNSPIENKLISIKPGKSKTVKVHCGSFGEMGNVADYLPVLDFRLGSKKGDLYQIEFTPLNEKNTKGEGRVWF